MMHSEFVTIANAVVVNTADKPDWAFPLHSHEHHLEISLLQAGEGRLYCGGRSYPMRCGDIIVKNAGLIHAEQASPAAPMQQVCLSFAGINEIAGHPGHLLPAYMDPVLPSGEDFGVLSAIFSYLAGHWQEEARFETCLHLTQAALDLISERISQSQRARANGPRGSRASEGEAMARIAGWLNEHYMQKITLNELAERFYVSPYYLDRQFKARIGYSINQYVINRRMGEAQKMLIFEDKTIKEIAVAVGYDNLQYFYATFKKYSGKTPSQFRTEFR